MKHFDASGVRGNAEPIREQDPIKQGLKLKIDDGQIPSIMIREQDPIKQGLKHSSENEDDENKPYS